MTRPTHRVLLLFFIALLAQHLFWPPLAMAQGPVSCVGGYYTLDFSFDSDLEGWTNTDNPAFGGTTRNDFAYSAAQDHTGNGGGSALHYHDASTQVTYANMKYTSSQMLSAIGQTGVISSSNIVVELAGYTPSGFDTSRARVFFNRSSSYEYQYQFLTVGGWGTAAYTSTVSGVLDSISLAYRIDSTIPYPRYYDDVTLKVPCGNIVETLLCPLVPNADFATDDQWSLSGTAVITNGVLSLNPDDGASQNISSLSSNTTYNLAIDVSDAVTSALNVSLGANNSVTFFGVTSGTLFSSFTTGQVSGPLAFKLHDVGAESIDIDFVCLSLASQGPGGEQSACIAPTNGEFTSADGWSFHRGASWSELSQDVSLPSNGDETNSGLVLTSGTFNLPSVITDSYLLLSFDAKSINDNGLVGANVDGISDFTGFFQTYTIFYTYESDVTDLAGENNVTLAFANAPTDTLDANITLDNACIFLSDRPPMLPYPTDPNSIDPVQIGFGFTSCADVDGIWAWLGVNMAQYRADYAAGFSIWDDPLQWVVAAVFVTLGDWSCLFMLGLASMLNLLEYILNNILNIFNWFRLGLPGIIDWGQGWGEFFGDSLSNLSNSYGDFLGDWANWIGSSLTNLSDWIGGYLASRSDWIGSSLTNLSGWIGNTLTAWADWIGASLANIAAWFSDAAIQNVVGALFLFSLLLNFFSFIWAILTWIWVNFITAAQIPIIMFESFNSGVQSAGFSGFINCSSNNLWCFLLAGVEIVNQSVGPTILYPFMIVAIVIGTIIILRDRIPDLYNFVLETIRGS